MSFSGHIGRIFVATCATLASGPIAFSEQPPAADRQPVAGSPAAGELVQQALRSRTLGNGDFADLLARALTADPRSEPAHWHSGFVRESGRWLKYDAVADDDAHRRRLDQYETERLAHADTVEDHGAMARWCREHDLPMQERAHLFKVLALDADNEPARAKLGYVRVGGQWVERAEIEDARRQKFAAERAFKKWSTVLKPIRLAFESGDATRIAAAREKLATIRDTEAIPAMETMLSRVNLDAASAVVFAIRQMQGPDAAVGLARQAVFAEWYPAGKLAAEALRDNDELSFVPLLLSGLSTPPGDTYRVISRVDPRRGRLFVRYEFQRERQDRIEKVVKDVSYGVWSYTGLGNPDPRVRSGYDFTSRLNYGINATDYVNEVLGQRAEFDGARLNDLVEQETRMTKALNERICRALRTAVVDGEQLKHGEAGQAEKAKQDLGDNPKAWWNWWTKRQEVFVAAQKTVTVTEFVSESPQYIPAYGRPVFLPSMSCLVAGTKVWTDVGPRAVETIRLGDLVLSQNVETGELAYRAVLQPTVRPAAPMVVLRFGKHEIRATGGHPFWAVGRGWMKARDFAPGMRMHSVNGPVEVTTIEPAPDAQAYNLVVDEFHTYFVGDDLVFSHDNVPPEPTHGGVPGESIR